MSGGAVIASAALFPLLANGAAEAEPLDPSIKPDAVLSVGQSVVLVNDDVLFGALLSFSPKACRGDSSTTPDQLGPTACKAYRVKLNRDVGPKAVNTVFFEASFDQTQVQSLPLVAAGLNPPPVGGYNVYVYDAEDHYLGQNAPDSTTEPIVGPGDPDDVSPGGTGFAEPEIGSFVAKTDTYDFVVVSTTGMADGFTLRITLSNELFVNPFEVLERIDTPAFEPYAEPDSTPPLVGGPGPGVVEPLPTAGLAPDDDIAGIGLGVKERFDARQALALGPQTRTVAATANPPSTIALVFGMLGFPVVAAVAVVFALRQRRQALVS